MLGENAPLAVLVYPYLTEELINHRDCDGCSYMHYALPMLSGEEDENEHSAAALMSFELIRPADAASAAAPSVETDAVASACEGEPGDHMDAEFTSEPRRMTGWAADTESGYYDYEGTPITEQGYA